MARKPNKIFDKYKDNPNPKANIGFMCYVPLNFWVYKNIYKHLPNSEFIICDNYDSEGYGYTPRALENLLDFFSKQNVFWRFNNPNNITLTKNEFYSKYALLASTWYRGDLCKGYNQDKKLVRVLYGHAKDAWNFGPWSAYFDSVLSYGEYSQKFLSLYGNSTIVGNPKFDDWFSDTLDQKTIEKIKSRLNQSKKTILYLPTMGQLSSLRMMINALYTASLKYNIIVKLHHNSLLYEKELVEPYIRNEKILVLNDKYDILPLLKIADFVISDNSGAIFDAILADKPLILVDFINESFYEKFKEKLFFRFDGTNAIVLTTRNSIEQIIKKPGKEIGSVIRVSAGNKNKKNMGPELQISYDELEKAILTLTIDNEKFNAGREKIRNMAFSFNDGKCGQRAAKKIEEILQKPKGERNFMAEALDKYFELFMVRGLGINKPDFWHSKKGRKEAAKRYLEIKSLPTTEKIVKIFNEFF
jgi:hypothetical protein